MGRLRTPTAIRKLNGNPSRRPLPENEPQPEIGEPEMPEGMTDRAKQHWDRLSAGLIELGVLTEADGEALGMLCQDMADLEDAKAELRKDGYTIEGSQSGVIRNPVVSVEQNLQKRVLIGLREFGLTPSSRTRVESKISKSGRSIHTEHSMAAFLEGRKAG